MAFKIKNNARVTGMNTISEEMVRDAFFKEKLRVGDFKPVVIDIQGEKKLALVFNPRNIY